MLVHLAKYSVFAKHTTKKFMLKVISFCYAF